MEGLMSWKEEKSRQGKELSYGQAIKQLASRMDLILRVTHMMCRKTGFTWIKCLPCQKGLPGVSPGLALQVHRLLTARATGKEGGPRRPAHIPQGKMAY